MAEKRLKKILDASRDMYLVVDSGGVLVDFQPSAAFDPIIPPEQFLGKSIEDVLPAGLARAGLERVEETLSSGRETQLEYSLPIDGTECFYEARFTPFDEDQVLVIIRDITQFGISGKACRSLMDASDDFFLLLDRKGHVLFINESATANYGKRPFMIEGSLFREHLTPEKAEVFEKRMEEILQTGEPARFTDRVDDRIFEVTANPVLEPSGILRHVACFIRDVTRQVAAENELVESGARYRRLFDENPVPMYIYDTKTLRILDVNNAMVDNYGYSREELTTMDIGHIRPVEDVSKVMENVDDLRSKQVYLGKWRHTKKDGSVIEVEITSGDFPYASRPARLVLCQDVTEKVKVQRDLEERELQYRHLFEHNPFPILVIDPESMEILNVNLAAIRHYGYEKDEFLNLNVLELRPAEDVEIAKRTIRASTGLVVQPGVFRHKKKDGTVILVDISSHGIDYEGRKARLVLCNDVTDQVHAREALKESEEKFRNAFLTSPDAMTISNLDDGILIDVNEGFVQASGYSREEAVGRSTLDLSLWANRERRDALQKELARKGRTENFEFEMRTKNGDVRSVLLSTNIIQVSGVPRRYTITRDITELKNAQKDLIKSEERLRASLKEKEILLKEIHHRVKNNLQVISGLLDLQTLHTDNEKIGQIYKESQNRIITMALIHEELYQSVNLSKVDFADYIRNLGNNLMISYGDQNGKINLEIEAEKTQMVIDTAIPCGLIINELVSNALKYAFPNGRKGTIRLTFRRLKKDEYLLRVTDDGVGLPESVDVFNTNTLGMHLVTVLVKQMGGAVTVGREKGTSITVRFREYHEAGSILY